MSNILFSIIAIEYTWNDFRSQLKNSLYRFNICLAHLIGTLLRSCRLLWQLYPRYRFVQELQPHQTFCIIKNDIAITCDSKFSLSPVTGIEACVVNLIAPHSYMGLSCQFQICPCYQLIMFVRLGKRWICSAVLNKTSSTVYKAKYSPLFVLTVNWLMKRRVLFKTCQIQF